MSSRIRRRSRSLLCSVTALLLAGCAGERGLEEKVLVIGIDGVRPDVLAEVPTPAIDALISEGAFSGRVITEAQTISGPGWSSMLTGVWPEKHGVTSNDFTGNNYATYPDFLSRLELIDGDFSTFAVVDWAPLGSEASGGPLLSDTIDVKLDFDGDQLGYQEGDNRSVAAAVRFLEHQDPDAAFVYIGYPDVAAHDHGGRSQEYYQSIETADVHVGRLVAALRNRPTYEREDWLILVSTDHGHRDAGGHGGDSPEERTVFFLASGPSVRHGTLPPDVNIVDVAVTALAHLGIAIDPAWHLEGRVSGLEAGN
ncbi:MAG: alkaline phosphatase family protein [Gemmatimonadota bacterium]|nr:MAG: alkaline phosphatase family protein [Gemmatimonadota bacterium]